jgi:hypothetical protein
MSNMLVRVHVSEGTLLPCFVSLETFSVVADGEFHGREAIRDYIVRVMAPYTGASQCRNWNKKKTRQEKHNVKQKYHKDMTRQEHHKMYSLA